MKPVPSVRYRVSHAYHPFKDRQKSIGLSVLSDGEGALDYNSFGANGTKSYRVQTGSDLPKIVLYPSLQALEYTQALEESKVSLFIPLSWQFSCSDL